VGGRVAMMRGGEVGVVVEEGDCGATDRTESSVRCMVCAPADTDEVFGSGPSLVTVVVVAVPVLDTEAVSSS
jgi:hypothetical protein